MTALAVSPTLVELLHEGDLDPGRPDGRTAGDWNRIVRDALPHGLGPWLYRSLERSGALGELPEDAAERLRGEALGVAARNLMLQDELVTLLRACAERGVACVPLRGLALAERLYGDTAGRPMGDLDLLVRKDELPRVSRILRDLGFRELTHRPGFAQAFSYTLVFAKERHGWILVEPHWTIAYPPFTDRLAMEGVWARCLKRRTVGVESWSLSREDLLLHLCLHLMHPDGTVPLLWFYEVDRLVRREQADLDWSRLSSIAGSATVGLLVAQALGRVRELFGTPVPEEVLAGFARPPRGVLHGRLSRLLGEGSDLDGREELAVFLTLGSVRLRLRYVLGLLFPSAQFMMTRYGLTHRSQLALAYLRRCCRLVWAGGRGIRRLIS